MQKQRPRQRMGPVCGHGQSLPRTGSAPALQKMDSQEPVGHERARGRTEAQPVGYDLNQARQMPRSTPV